MNNNKRKVIITFILFVPFVLIFASLFIGRYPLSVNQVVTLLWDRLIMLKPMSQTIEESIVWDIRLPRAILAALIGASLASSGAALQGLFRNPLVDSGILGVSAGAGFGAALAIILFDSIYMIYLLSFCFGLLAVFFSYLVGKIANTTPTIMLVLGGTIVASMFSACLSFLKYVADPLDELPAITFWLMGSLASASFQDILIASIPMTIGVIGLLLIRYRINVLSIGDKEAQTLGINVKTNKLIIIVCSTLATAGAVSVAGMIGWIGLIIPHIGRMMIGNDNRYLLPISIGLGASFLIIVDNVGRALTGSELPLSIITSIIGGPFYIYILKKTKGGGW